jgi:ubiquinone/menaquinone biosynthesis C-methylase UbiE
LVGDIAFRIIKALQATPMESRMRKTPSRVTICDINPSMLKVGQQRARVRGLEKPGVCVTDFA